MHFKINIDGDVQVFRNANTDVKILRRIYLDAKVPYESPSGITPGEIICEHDFPLGEHDAIIEAFEPTAHYQANRKVLVGDGKITIM